MRYLAMISLGLTLTFAGSAGAQEVATGDQPEQKSAEQAQEQTQEQARPDQQQVPQRGVFVDHDGDGVCDTYLARGARRGGRGQGRGLGSRDGSGYGRGQGRGRGRGRGLRDGIGPQPQPNSGTGQ